MKKKEEHLREIRNKIKHNNIWEMEVAEERREKKEKF